MKHHRIEERDNIVQLTFDSPDGKVNVFSFEALSELKQSLTELSKRTDIEMLLFKSAKPNIFVAGADISEINSIHSLEDGIQKAKAGQEIMNLVEDLPFPTVALIDGACVGGGLEFALACTYRIATFNESVRIGLPETKLGIIPGFGGTVRLPKRVGLLKALDMILKGSLLNSQRAYKAGLVQHLAPASVLVTEAITMVKSNSRFPVRLSRLEKLCAKLAPVKKMLISKTCSAIRKAQGNSYPHLFNAARSTISAWGLPRTQALAVEADHFGSAIQTGVYKSLIHLFNLSEKYKKKKWTESSSSNIKTVGILGAGVMGGGIAQLFAAKGYSVRLKDISHDAVNTGLKSAYRVFEGALKKRRITPADLSAGMSRISPTLTGEGLGNCDLIIEAVVEDMKIKKSVLKDIANNLKPDSILATNTSSLSIEQMSADLPESHKLVGMHFFNPVHLMPLVEVIRYSGTSDKSIQTVVDISRKLGKTPVVVRDGAGFLVNRILMPFLNEAGYLLEDGVDFIYADKLLKTFGMPMSAFRLLDEIGIDVAYKVAGILENAFGDRMKMTGTLNKIYSKKLLGRKTGAGFYLYKNKDIRPNPDAKTFEVPSGKTISDQDIIDRCVLQMVNEAAFCIESKICAEASDVDIAMVMGTGFPPFRGGLLKYADERGLKEVVNRLRHFESTVSQVRFKPCGLLVKLAESGQTFYNSFST